jgi:hypothetical protein
LEASVSLAGSHGDALELSEFAEEILDEVMPSVDFSVDLALRPTPKRKISPQPASGYIEPAERPHV